MVALDIVLFRSPVQEHTHSRHGSICLGFVVGVVFDYFSALQFAFHCSPLFVQFSHSCERRIHHCVFNNLLSLRKIKKRNELFGSRDGAAESTRLPPMWLGFDSGLGVICGLSLLLVLVLASTDFSPGTPIFSSPFKNQHSQIPIRSRESPQLGLYAKCSTDN